MSFLRLHAVLSAGLGLAALIVPTPADAQHHRAHTPDAFEAPDAFVVPPRAASFAYEVTRTVDHGMDAYEGYSDSLTSAGGYTLAGEGDSVRVQADYTWRYFGTPCDDGHEVRDVVVDANTRFYEGGTDLDDYDDKPGPLATWLWVPTTIRTGEMVQILDRAFTYTGRAPGLRGEVMTLEAHYSEHRVDSYGDFNYATVDTYHFDAETGFFVDEQVIEEASGTTEGAYGEFVMTTNARVTSATYLDDGVVHAAALPALCASDYAPSTEPYIASDSEVFWTCCGVPLLILFIPTAAILYFMFRKRRPRGVFDIAALTAPEVTPEMMRLTPTFAPFLRHFMVVAARTQEPVYVAKTRDLKELKGLAFVDRETMLGTIFTSDPEACEELRRTIRMEDFFTEVQHTVIPSVQRATNLAKPAYNTLETYDVLVRTSSESPVYDPDVVSRAQPADRDAILAISLLVHGIRGQAWFDASIEAGDLCFVARINGGIAGFAMLTVQGAHARLHTNTVHPEFRGRGIGKELARARIHTALALGATQQLTEVATWNVASLEVVRSLGFEKKSAMYVSTARAERIEKKALRR